MSITKKILGKKKHKEKTTYGIIGLGRFGFALANELASSGADILVLDKDEDKIREALEITDNALIVRSLDKKTLAETGIQECDVVVLCIGEQIDTSILTTLNLISLGVKHVIAKAKSAEHGEILEKLGAEVVYPERDMAVRVANRLESARVLDFIQLSEKVNIFKFPVPSIIVGKTVLEANLRAKYALNIIAIENCGEVIEYIKPDYVFRENDILFLSGKKDSLQKLADRSE